MLPTISFPSENKRTSEKSEIKESFKSMDTTSQNAATGGNNGIITAQPNINNGNSNTEATTSDESKQNLSDVTNSIEKTLGLLHQLYLTVSSFNVSSRLPLLHRINALVMELDNMMKLSNKCNIQIPMEVLNLIDDGKNPDEFTRDVLNSCIAKNQITKGKTDAFKSLRKHLLEELEQAFPSEVENYRDSRASSAAELKRMAQAQSALPNGDVKVKSEL